MMAIRLLAICSEQFSSLQEVVYINQVGYIIEKPWS